jgi:signal transduction histidine kinase
LRTISSEEAADPGEQGAWERHSIESERSQARLFTLLATLLLPAWAPFDYLLEREQAPAFWVLRLLDTGLGLIVLGRLRRADTLARVRTLAAVKLVATGGVIAVMLPLVAQHFWPYVMGFSLVFWGAAVVYSIPLHVMGPACGLVLAIAGASHLAVPRDRTSAELVGATFYIVTTVIIALTQIAFRRRLEHRAFRSAHHLAEASRKVLENERLKDQFFANVSHELRTPLALVIGPAETLLAAAPDDVAKRDLEIILRNARTLLKHVDDLLEVSRLSAGRLRLDYAEVDAARMLRLAAARFEWAANQRQLAFRVETPPSLSAELDPDSVERVIANLLGNAFKFTPDGGSVRCSVRAGGDWLILEVADSGPGIPPDERQAVFDRFRQLDGGSTRRFGGIGLGLAIVRELVELHGGKIAVEQAPEGGALFRVELPLSAPETAQVRPAATIGQGAPERFEDLEARESGEPEASADAGSPLVLVIEDNLDMNRFVRNALAPHFRTESAFDGAEGLVRALALRPDLIISDLMMPEMSGEELIARIRAHPELEPVPILVLTARADDALRARLLSQGAQDHLLKPFLPDELRSRVANLVSAKRVRELLRHELQSRTSDVELLTSELLSQRRELKTALEVTRLLKDQAEQASQAKTAFLTMVSHELRTPLAAARLQLDLILRADLPEHQAELARRMSVRLTRLTELVISLLEYSRIQSGRLTLSIRPFDVAELAAECMDEIQAQAADKGLELRRVVPEPLLALSSDRDLVRLILVNLLGNAVKFTERGSVTLAIHPKDDSLRFEVTDTGPGIPAEDQARIFEAFEQLTPVRHKHLAGVGLGLALVRELAQALGGSVALRSTPSTGSTFSIELPQLAVAERVVEQRAPLA